ncbi:MAG: PQQ-dependent sugar dehydrogenase [Candidatus Hydrogenedentales bacterium]
MPLNYRLMGILALLILSAVADAGDEEAEFLLKTVVVASGVERPVFVRFAPGETERLFTSSWKSGTILVAQNGQILDEPFLDISDKVGAIEGEQALQDMAFHPDYADNGYFFVMYTDLSGDQLVERYQVSADNPNRAVPSSAATVLGPISQPSPIHNGSSLVFGPDEYLYIGLGDGGPGADPRFEAQNLDTLLGKILRVDVNNGLPATPPPDNPFYARGGDARFIWVYGLRNPWRFSFDRMTGDLYIGDVGEEDVEEVSFQSGASAGGENFGWSLMEGDMTFRCGPGQSQAECADARAATVPPIFTYAHQGSFAAVTAGYVYRGSAIPELVGHFLFADFLRNQIWSFRYDGANLSDLTDWSSELNPDIIRPVTVCFGEDAAGELYIARWASGEIVKIVRARPLPAPRCASGAMGARATTWGDGVVWFFLLVCLFATRRPFDAAIHPAPHCATCPLRKA